jgi:hypothetical protein
MLTFLFLYKLYMPSYRNRNSLLLPKNKKELQNTLTNIGHILVKNKILNGLYNNNDARSAIEAIASQLDPLTRTRSHRNSLNILRNPRIKTKSRKHRNSLNIIRKKLHNKPRPRTRRRRSVGRSIHTPYKRSDSDLIDLFGEPSNNLFL